MILNETMNEIADAIREKTGKSEKIAPVNFAEEIKSISAGGGGAEGDWHYFDMSGVAPDIKTNGIIVAMLVKLEDGAISLIPGRYIGPSGVFGMLEIDTDKCLALACDYSTEIFINGMKGTIGESVPTSPWYADAREITKEEFYAL